MVFRQDTTIGQIPHVYFWHVYHFYTFEWWLQPSKLINAGITFPSDLKI